MSRIAMPARCLAVSKVPAAPYRRMSLCRSRPNRAWIALALLVGASLAGCTSSVSSSHAPAPTAVITPIGYAPVTGSGSMSITVRSGADVTLSAKDTDDNGIALKSFLWSQSAGPPLPALPDAGALLYRTNNTVSFRAPQVTSQTPLTFQVEVTNVENQSSTAQITVNVVPANDQDEFLLYPQTQRSFTVAVSTENGIGAPAGAALGASVPVCVSVRRNVSYLSRNDQMQSVALPQLKNLQVDASWAAGSIAAPATGAAAMSIQTAVDSYSNPRVSFLIPSLNDEELFAMFNQPSNAQPNMQLVAADIDTAQLALTVSATPGSCDGTQSGAALASSNLIVSILDENGNALLSSAPAAAGQPAQLSTIDQQGDALTPDWLWANVAANQPVSTAAMARAYYEAIDPQATAYYQSYASNPTADLSSVDPKSTLDGWLDANCFDHTSSDYGTGAAGPNGAHAVYTNNYDLGFGRDMYFIKCAASGNMASVVINYASLEQTALKDTPLLAVAMEYAPAPSGGRSFPKFYIFAPDDRTGQFRRVLSANFDKRGQKYVPGACTACHGGALPTLQQFLQSANGTYPAIADPTNPAAALLAPGDVDSAFLPWDVDSFLFSDNDPSFKGNFISGTNFTRAMQEPHLKALNQLAYMTWQRELESAGNPSGTYDRFAAVRALVEKWYGGAGMPNATYCDTAACQSSGAASTPATPAGWAGQDTLYHGAFARNCRTCHTVDPLIADQFSGLTSLPSDGFALLQSEFTQGTKKGLSYVFEQGIMPLARLTTDRFWVSSTQGDQAAAAVLASNLGLSGAAATVGTPHARIEASVDGTTVFPATLPDSVPRTDNNVDSGATIRLSGDPSAFATQYGWTLAYAPSNARFTSSSVLVGSQNSDAAFSPDEPGTYTVTLTVSNGAASDSQQATFTVPDKLPSIVGPVTTAASPVSLSFAATPSIPLIVELGEGACSQHVLSVSASAGSISAAGCASWQANPDGSYTVPLTYTPAAVGPATIQAALQDEYGQSSGTFTLYATVTSSLVANQDTASAAAGNPASAVPVCVLDNDALNNQTVTVAVSQTNGGPALSSITTSAGGTASVESDANCSGRDYVSYTPPASFIGVDTFYYTINGPGNQTSSASVTVTTNGTIDFESDLLPTLQATCAGCHGPAGPATTFLPAAASTATAFYNAICGATNTGPCGSVNPGSGPLIDIGTPGNSQLYVEPTTPPGGMPQDTAFANMVLQWASEGAYCTKTGAACP
jgi:hypothetical protein